MLEIKNLTKRFGNRAVIENLSLSIPVGDRLCLFAPSGAGKTTLIRILTGLEKAFTGMYHIDTPRRATLFQEPGLFWYKTVAENIFHPFEIRRIPIDQAVRSRYAEWIDATGLKGFENHYPHQLSGGMKQKAAIVRGMLSEPELVLMDEPFKSIDGAAKRRIIEFLDSAYPDLTIILVTHSVDEIFLLARRLLLFEEQRLSNGRIIPLSADDFPRSFQKKNIFPWE